MDAEAAREPQGPRLVAAGGPRRALKSRQLQSRQLRSRPPQSRQLRSRQLQSRQRQSCQSPDAAGEQQGRPAGASRQQGRAPGSRGARAEGEAPGRAQSSPERDRGAAWSFDARALEEAHRARTAGLAAELSRKVAAGTATPSRKRRAPGSPGRQPAYDPWRGLAQLEPLWNDPAAVQQRLAAASVAAAELLEEHGGEAFARLARTAGADRAARPLTTEPGLPRHARTALGARPLPSLATSFGATEGWLFRQGTKALPVVEVPGVVATLQWRLFFFVADPGAGVLLQQLAPTSSEASSVIILRGARVRSGGWRRLTGRGGAGDVQELFTIRIESPTKVGAGRETVVLGCGDQGRALKWLASLRAATAPAAPAAAPQVLSGDPLLASWGTAGPATWTNGADGLAPGAAGTTNVGSSSTKKNNNNDDDNDGREDGDLDDPGQPKSPVGVPESRSDVPLGIRVGTSELQLKTHARAQQPSADDVRADGESRAESRADSRVNSRGDFGALQSRQGSRQRNAQAVAWAKAVTLFDGTAVVEELARQGLVLERRDEAAGRVQPLAVDHLAEELAAREAAELEAAPPGLCRKLLKERAKQKRRRKSPAELAVEAAAVEAARPAWRVVTVEWKAAERVQAVYRGWVARVDVNGPYGRRAQRACATVIQTAARRALAVRLARRLRERRDAATIIPCAARSCESRSEAARGRRRRDAAGAIQRGRRCQVARRRRSALEEERSRAAADCVAALADAVENDYHAWCARELKLKRQRAALVLQCTARRARARAVVDAKRRQRAATRLEAQARARLLRRAYLRKRVAAVTIQRTLARGAAGRAVAMEARRRRDAATALQMVWRGRRARIKLARARRAALQIQCWVRIFHARTLSRAQRELRSKRRAGAAAMQAVRRGHVARQLVWAAPGGLVPRRQAAVRLQSWARARAPQRGLFAAKVAALTLQRWWRRCTAASETRRRRAAWLDANARVMQRAVRDWLYWRAVRTRQEAFANAFVVSGKLDAAGATREVFRGAVTAVPAGTSKGRRVVRAVFGAVRIVSRTGDLEVRLHFAVPGDARAAGAIAAAAIARAAAERKAKGDPEAEDDAEEEAAAAAAAYAATAKVNLRVGGWFVAIFASWLIKSAPSQAASGPRGVARALAKLLAHAVVSDDGGRELIRSCTGGEMPSAFDAIARAKAARTFWEQGVLGAFRAAPGHMPAIDEDEAAGATYLARDPISERERELWAFVAAVDSFASMEVRRALQLLAPDALATRADEAAVKRVTEAAFAVAEKLPAGSPVRDLAKLLATLGTFPDDMFEAARASALRALSATRSAASAASAASTAFAAAVPARVISRAASGSGASRTTLSEHSQQQQHSQHSQQQQQQQQLYTAPPLPRPLAASCVAVLTASTAPSALFALDLEAYDFGVAARAESLDALFKSEALLLSAMTDVAVGKIFTEPIRRARARGIETQIARKELADDQVRWRALIVDVERRVAAQESMRSAEATASAAVRGPRMARRIANATRRALAESLDPAERVPWAESEEAAVAAVDAADHEAEWAEEDKLQALRREGLAFDSGLYELLKQEAAYLRSALVETAPVLTAQDELIAACESDAAWLERRRTAMAAAVTELRGLIERGRVYRASITERERTAITATRPLAAAVETATARAIGATAASAADQLRGAGSTLNRHLPLLARRAREALRAIGELDVAVAQQRRAASQLSAGAAAFAAACGARDAAMNRRLAESAAALDALRARAVAAISREQDLVKNHRIGYERFLRQEDNVRKLLDKEIVAATAQAHYETFEKAKTGRARLDELEAQIVADAPKAREQARRLLKAALMVCKSAAERLCFERGQLDAAQRALIRVCAAVDPGTVSEADLDEAFPKRHRGGARGGKGKQQPRDAQAELGERDLVRADKEIKNVVRRYRAAEPWFRDLQNRLDREGKAIRDKQRLLRKASSGDSSSGGDSSGESGDSDSDASNASGATGGSRRGGELARRGSECHLTVSRLEASLAEYLGIADALLDATLASPSPPEKNSTVPAAYALLRRAAESPPEPAAPAAGLSLAQRLHLLPARALAVARGVQEQYLVQAAARLRELRRDPLGRVKLREHAAAIECQKVIRGWLVRRRVRNKAARVIQNMFRRWRDWRFFKYSLCLATCKFYDTATGRYYYVWPGGTAWEPPMPCRGRHIRYGQRLRERGYAWAPDEAASVIQACYRGMRQRRVYYTVLHAAYVKVWEPGKQRFFYRNVRTKHCQWHKPIGLKPTHDIALEPGLQLPLTPPADGAIPRRA
jgi:hypothetical protein